MTDPKTAYAWGGHGHEPLGAWERLLLRTRWRTPGGIEWVPYDSRTAEGATMTDQPIRDMPPR